jgi:hypothetical protein
LIPKREAKLKADFTKELRIGMPHALMLFYASAGAPDREIVCNKRYSQWEFKHATPNITSSGIQELMCMRLAHQGYCRYVLWLEDFTSIQRTLILHPNQIHNAGLSGSCKWEERAEAQCVGFDHGWLVEHVKRVHHV